MWREDRSPYTDLSIRRTADAGRGVDPSTDAMQLCPACVQPMAHVRTIWRAFRDDLQVFECWACGVSVTLRVPET
jgi:hypothetical protein